MFLGMQNDLIAVAKEKREELLNIPCIEFTSIVETNEPVEFVNNRYYVGENDIIFAKQQNIRSIRNNLLVIEVDPLVTNPLRWEDMDEKDKQDIRDYRHYLLDYTETDKWWEKKPLSFTDWKNQDESEEESK